jgi:predicted RNA-binding protein associated with RNAse of E/G family
MTDVVDADELLRRIRRGQERAAEEERAWRERARTLTATDPEGAREATDRARAFEAVLRVLEEIVRPGGGPVQAEGVKRVT